MGACVRERSRAIYEPVCLDLVRDRRVRSVPMPRSCWCHVEDDAQHGHGGRKVRLFYCVGLREPRHSVEKWHPAQDDGTVAFQVSRRPVGPPASSVSRIVIGSTGARC